MLLIELPSVRVFIMICLKKFKKGFSEGFNKVFLQNLIIVYNTCHDHRGMHIHVHVGT